MKTNRYSIKDLMPLFLVLVFSMFTQIGLYGQCYVEDLDPTSFDFPASGGTQTNDIVYTNGSCTYSLTFISWPNWISSVTQPNSYDITVVCNANPDGGGSRNGLVTYSYNGLTQSFAVSQDASTNPPQAPNTPNLVANSNGCGQVTLERSGNPSSGVTWYWQGTNSNGVSTASSNNAENNDYVATQSGTYYIRARGSNGLWSSSVARAVTVIDLEPGVIENNNVSICYGGDPPQIDSFEDASGIVGSYTYQWEQSVNGGSWTEITNANGSSYNPPSGLTATTKYRRKVSCGLQEEVTNEATVTVISLPEIANGNDVSRCGTGSVTLSATAGANGNTVRWYSSSTGGSPIHTGFNYGTPSLSATTSYYAESYNSTTGCVASSRQLIRAVINQIPGSANGNDTARCGNGTVTLNATLGSNANEIRWYSTSSGGSSIHTGTSFTTPSLSATTTYYAESYNSSTGCTSTARTAIQAQVENVITWYLDADGDGRAVSTADSCSSPGAGYTQTVLPLDDCDDGNSGIQGPVTWYLDSDGDGLGDPSEPSAPSCTAPANHVANNSDLCPGHASPTNDCEISASTDPETHNYVYSRTYQSEVATVPSNKFVSDDAYIQQITFFDGLGRPRQQNAIRQSPDQKDIITHIGYDDYGRQETEWLPLYEPNGGLGDFRTGDQEAATRTYYKNHADYGLDFPTATGTDVNPYSQKEFEPSPLSRVRKQAAPGEDWKLGNGHEIEFAYESNSASDNVKQYRVSLAFTNNTYMPSLVDDGDYSANELYKNTTYDENHSSGNNHSVEEFTDKQGRVVLKRTYADTENSQEVAHNTYYVYDDFGNLTFVIPPLVDTSVSLTQTVLDDLCYQYVYDHRNRLVEKKIPGKGWEYIVYNNLDQPILTQDANQRTKDAGSDEWLFTKYDAFGRVAYTGIAEATESALRTTIQTEVDGLGTLWETQTSTDQDANFTEVVSIYYSNGAYPNNSLQNRIVDLVEVLTVNYYDDYDWEPQGFPTAPTTVFDESVNYSTQGLATGSRIKVLGTSDWITAITRYDAKGRPIYTYSQNDYLQTTDVVESLLDFVGRPVKVRSEHTRNGSTVVTLDNFTYDHAGRLLSQTQCIGDHTLGESCGELNVENILVLDQPTVSSSQTATSRIQVVPTANAVTISGTLTLKVDPNAGGSGGSGNAGEELIVFNDYDDLGQLEAKKVGGDPGNNYGNTSGLQTVDYAYNVRGWLTDINDVTDTTPDKLFNFHIAYNGGNTPLYNGNIARTQWRTDNDDSNLKQYDYGYDALNRITDAVSNVGTDRYGLSGITYDKNGNIQTLLRNGHVVESPNPNTSSHFGAMDNLSYSYNGNQLTNVADNNASDTYGFVDVNGGGTEYTYDANGNMITDANKNITAISYNYLNLPTSIVINGQTISYIYDAAGTKLKKTAGSSVTDYAGNYVYSNNGGNTTLEFLSHSEGYASPELVSGSITNWNHIYQYKDHLGNIRLSYVDNNGTLEIVEENNYYPFGLKHKGYNDAVSANGNDVANRWKYNGIELDETSGLYEMPLRQYDPSIARWTSIDPVTHFSMSTYTAFDNNPVFWADPSGADSWKYLGGGTYINRRTGEETTDWRRAVGETSGGTDSGSKDEKGFADISTGGIEGDSAISFGEELEHGSFSEGSGEQFPWPFPGAYFGKLRHLAGPDAIAISLDIDLATPKIGGVFSPIGVLLVLKGPEAGSIEYIYDIGVAAGLDISASGKITELYFNGKTNDIRKGTFLGLRVGADIAVTVGGIDFGRGISYSPSDTFLANAVFGLSTSIGYGIPAPVMINGNMNAGYTGSWEKLIEAVGDDVKKIINGN
nr:DUF6443 domain-containing protein [Allomuricauda sp.]